MTAGTAETAETTKITATKSTTEITATEITATKGTAERTTTKINYIPPEPKMPFLPVCTFLIIKSDYGLCTACSRMIYS